MSAVAAELLSMLMLILLRRHSIHQIGAVPGPRLARFVVGGRDGYLAMLAKRVWDMGPLGSYAPQWTCPRYVYQPGIDTSWVKFVVAREDANVFADTEILCAN